MNPVEFIATGPHHWTSDLSVGIAEIDEEHRQFFSLTNDLDAALARDSSKSDLRRLMDRMIENASQHFAHEERLFALYAFPEAEVHAGMHAQIIGQLTEIKQQFDRINFALNWKSIGTQIRDLLTDHLLQADMRYRGQLRARVQFF